jgi:hypothetical protein
MCFWSNLRKISNIVPLGNQIEAIALLEITPSKSSLVYFLKNETSLLMDHDIFLPNYGSYEIDTETINLNVPDNTSDLAFTFSKPFDKILKLSKRVDK